MTVFWQQFIAAWPLIFNGNPYLWQIIGFTLEVAAVATAVATLLGLPVALTLGLGRFRGRRVLHAIANASLALPPVLVGATLFLLLEPRGPFGSLNLIWTREVVLIVQSILALPYVIALGAAAIQGLPPGLLDQARALHASRLQLAALALREARIGVLAAVIAALGTSLSEVAAIVILGGNIYGYDQTLASASLYEANGANYGDAMAIAIVLLALTVLLIGGLTLLQERGRGIRYRFSPGYS
jgi:tungstate transport system permease protein